MQHTLKDLSEKILKNKKWGYIIIPLDSVVTICYNVSNGGE